MYNVMQSDLANLSSSHAAEAVRLLKALASEQRLLVLCYLAEAGAISAGGLTEQVGLSQSALSQHLAKLREEGLVATRKGSSDDLLPRLRSEGRTAARASS